MEPYALILSGGKQHRVKVGATLRVEKLLGNEGDQIEFDKVLLVTDGTSYKLGKPYVAGSIVKAEIVSHGRGKKVTIFKLKRRKTYRRKQGHRQDYTEVQIKSIH